MNCTWSVITLYWTARPITNRSINTLKFSLKSRVKRLKGTKERSFNVVWFKFTHGKIQYFSLFHIHYHILPEERTIANCYGQNWTTNKYVRQCSLHSTYVLLGIPAKLNKTCSLHLDVFFFCQRNILYTIYTYCSYIILYQW